MPQAATQERQVSIRAAEYSGAAHAVAVAPSPQNLPATLDKLEGAIALASNPEEINGVLALMDAAVAYAKRYYKDQQDVIQRAKSLRLQAERRLGEMLRDMPKATAGRPTEIGSALEPINRGAPTLADIGIDKKVSMRAQRLAALPAEKFEQVSAGVISVAQAIATPSEQKAMRKQGKAKAGPRADAIREEIKAAQQRGASMLSSYARLILTAIKTQEEFSTEERDLLSQVASAINQL